MEKVVPVDEQTLTIINEKLKGVDVAVSSCMSYIRRVQDIPFNQLSSRCRGVPGIMWKRYMQPSYPKMRPLHVVAAYSWLTMVPMPSFYRGLAIKESYRGMDEEAVAAMIHCGILPKKQYNLLLEHIFEYLSEEGRTAVIHFRDDLHSMYGHLDDYTDEQFMFPETLDMNLFQEDYYHSVALAFREFRRVNNFSQEDVARILSMSQHRYQQCENPDNPVPLPVDIAARLKLGFQLTDAMPFTSHMKIYPQFHTVRRVQHIRETTLVEMMRYVLPAHKKQFIEIIKNMAQIYSRELLRQN